MNNDHDSKGSHRKEHHMKQAVGHIKELPLGFIRFKGFTRVYLGLGRVQGFRVKSGLDKVW